ncbi:MAG: glycoside hydrolase family 43 protein [Agriterribacter sp.]
MKYSIIPGIIGLLFCCSAIAQSDSVYMFSYFKENGQDGLHLAYSKDGYSFQALKHDSSFLQPIFSKDRLMRDPCIIRGNDNLFHMVWTVSWSEKGIGYASSPDLVHWSKQLFIPVMQYEPKALNCWAPEITYDTKNKQYIIYWATSIPGRFTATDSSGDGNYNHRMYYVTTKNFTSFSKAALLYDKGFNTIDATIQPDNGKYIMFLKNETKRPVAQKNLRIAVSDRISGGYSAASAPITGAYWAEGPTVTKVNGEWIVYFDKYMDHKYGAVASTDLKRWTDISDKISFPDGVRHGTVFKISAKEFAVFSQQ